MSDTAPSLENDLAELRRLQADVTYKLGYLCGVVDVDPYLPLPAFTAAVRQKLPLVRPSSAEAELQAIKRGHGELGRYEKLRLKNAELTAALAALENHKA